MSATLAQCSLWINHFGIPEIDAKPYRTTRTCMGTGGLASLRRSITCRRVRLYILSRTLCNTHWIQPTASYMQSFCDFLHTHWNHAVLEGLSLMHYANFTHVWDSPVPICNHVIDSSCNMQVTREVMKQLHASGITTHSIISTVHTSKKYTSHNELLILYNWHFWQSVLHHSDNTQWTQK